MFDLEKLYQRLQKNSQYAVTYQNGQITVTLSRGEVSIREKWAQMLIQGRVYEECEWDELDSADDLAAIVDEFNAFLERMGRDHNETYQTANRAVTRWCGWVPFLMFVMVMGCLAMMGRTEDIRWLVAFLACPLLMIVLLGVLRRGAFRRYWACPQCRQPLPLVKGKLLPQMEYAACCPHCGQKLEQIPPVEPLSDEEYDELAPDPAPPVPGSPWPARICGGVGVLFAALMALVLAVCCWPENPTGLVMGTVLMALCLLISLLPFFCRAPGLPTSIQPIVVVREGRVVVWLGIPLWFLGLVFTCIGVILTAQPPLDVPYILFMGVCGLGVQLAGAWLLLARRNRVLYIWKEHTVTYLGYTNSWGRLRRFEAGQVVSTRLTANQSVHLLNQNGKKLAAVELNMPGADRLLTWLAMQDMQPTLTPAMQRYAEQKGLAEPETVCWREEYRTRWHSHLKAIRVGMWAVVILLGACGILPAALYLKDMLKFTAMIGLMTLGPLMFFTFCFVFSPVLVFGDRPKGATDEWNAMHIKMPLGWIILISLAYLYQTAYLWSKWVFQVAGGGLNWVIQSAVLIAVLTALVALVTPRRLRKASVPALGLLVFFFSMPIVYGINLTLSGPTVHTPLVIVDSHVADPEDDEDEYTLTVQLEDGSETELNVFDTTYEMAMNGEALVLCQKKSPLGMSFVSIHKP